VELFRRSGEACPGERLTLFRLMKDLYLDQLAVAGGEGTDILRRVRRQALSEFR
jgi:hypothetical protein